MRRTRNRIARVYRPATRRLHPTRATKKPPADARGSWTLMRLRLAAAAGLAVRLVGRAGRAQARVVAVLVGPRPVEVRSPKARAPAPRLIGVAGHALLDVELETLRDRVARALLEGLRHLGQLVARFLDALAARDDVVGDVESREVHFFLVALDAHHAGRALAADAAVEPGQVTDLVHRHLHVDEPDDAVLVRDGEVVLVLEGRDHHFLPRPGVVPDQLLGRVAVGLAVLAQRVLGRLLGVLRPARDDLVHLIARDLLAGQPAQAGT